MAKRNGKKHGSIFKRLVGNKNTVTILGLLACVATLIIGYNYRVGLAIDPVELPYARQDLPARTLITNDMIGRIKVARDYVSRSQNLAKTTAEVVNHYVSYKTNIPKGSLFYKDVLKEAEEMPDAAFANIEDGYVPYSLSVNAETTYANSIRAGDYIDLYMSATDNNNGNKVMYGCLIKSIRVLAVKDSKGNNIVKNTLVYGKPSELLFAVDEEMYKLLSQAEYIRSGDIKITPYVRNKNYTENPNPTTVDSNTLRNFIKSQVTELR